MAQFTIRLSPSGAPLTNDDGGPADPGEGFILRRFSRARQIEAKNVPTVGSTLLTYADTSEVVLALATPATNKRYALNCRFQAENNSDTSGILTIAPEVSYDNQVVWTPLSSHEHEMKAFGTTPVVNSARLVSADIEDTLGSALAVPVPAAAPEIAIRFRLSADAGVINTLDGGAGGSLWAQLVESL